MKKIFLAVLFILFMFTAICVAKSPTFIPQAISENQKIIYTQGIPILVSETDNTAIAISMSYGNKELYIDIAIRNKADADIDVIPENIQVIGYNKKNVEKPIEVYFPEKYYAKVTNKMVWNIILQGLAAASDSYTAGTSTTTTRSSNGNILATSTTYDPAKASQVAAQDQDAIRKTGEDSKTELDSLKKFLLWRNTLKQNVTIEGNVVARYDYSFNKKYKVIIPIGTDTYEVQFIND